MYFASTFINNEIILLLYLHIFANRILKNSYVSYSGQFCAPPVNGVAAKRFRERSSQSLKAGTWLVQSASTKDPACQNRRSRIQCAAAETRCSQTNKIFFKKNYLLNQAKNTSSFEKVFLPWIRARGQNKSPGSAGRVYYLNCGNAVTHWMCPQLHPTLRAHGL